MPWTRVRLRGERGCPRGRRYPSSPTPAHATPVRVSGARTTWSWATSEAPVVVLPRALVALPWVVAVTPGEEAAAPAWSAQVTALTRLRRPGAAGVAPARTRAEVAASARSDLVVPRTRSSSLHLRTRRRCFGRMRSAGRREDRTTRTAPRAPSNAPGCAVQSGTLPCLRCGSSSRLVLSIFNPATSLRRVSAGSITSSM